ncbi:DUF4302 domain-containing protein [Aquimarina algiphila]|uniref:DUF4302 domain-containing protein n=1 Tax=Aquimarina algiphila TaxID=2047982 RepID=UPI00232E3120|nr:DUF4302 domain-containing protein [Aquimarina algiphila]
MIIKALKKIWFLSLLLVFFSCSNDDNEELFNETPSTRIDQRISELQNLLLASPDGYRAIYFTKDDEYGGFTFYMKFNSDGTVEMTSDVDSETAITSSRYEVKMGTTTELLFSTRNHIHKVSDSNIPGLIGSGYEGNSNFMYIKNEGGNITFIEPRNEATIVFEPVNAGDWANVNTSLARRSSLLPSVTSSVFQALTIEDTSGNKTFYTFEYDPLRLFANSVNQAADGTISEISYGIAYTPDGLVVSPSIQVGDNAYENFTFDEMSKSYISDIGGNKASIGFLDEPTFISNDFQDLGNDFDSFLYAPADGTSPLTSLGFDALVEELNTNMTPFGLTFNLFAVFITVDGDSTLLIRFVDGTGAALDLRYTLKTSIKDKKIFFEDVTPNDGNSAFLATQMEPLTNFWASTEGLYYNNTGNYFQFIDQSGTFTSAQNPALRIYGLWF